MDWSNIYKVLLPEFTIVAGIFIALLLALCSKTARFSAYVSVAALAIASMLSAKGIFDSSMLKQILSNSFVADSFSYYMRTLVYGIAAVIALTSKRYLEKLESPAEYFPLFMTATLGAGFLSGVHDFIAMFIALETLSLSAILLVAYARKKQNSNESGIKYLITSAMATTMFLLAISLIYGLTSSTNFAVIGQRIAQLMAFEVFSIPLQIMIAGLLVASLGFKMAAAPFHNWSPDVYTGAPTSTTLFLSVISKIAAFSIAIRIFTTVYHSQIVLVMIAILALLSVVFGNFIGLAQIVQKGSLKRVLAYSSVAQSGYLLIALSVLRVESLSSIVLYLTIYALMNTAAFAAVIGFERLTGSDKIYDLAGIIKHKPMLTVIFAIALCNLAGLPLIPAGFIAKFFLFASAYQSQLPYAGLLVLVGLLTSVIALFYYLYAVKILVVDEESKLLQNTQKISELQFDYTKFGALISVSALIFFGVFGMDFLKNLSDLAIFTIAK